MTMTGIMRKSGVKLLAATTLCFALGALPAAAQDSRAIGGAAGAAGGAGIGYGLGGTKGAIIGGLLGAGLGVGAGHLVRENNKSEEQQTSSPYPYQDNLVYDTKNELVALGYQPGPMDNTYDQQTAWAVQSYQHNNGLIEDAQPSAWLLDHMRQTRARMQGGGYSQPPQAYQQPTYQQGNYVPPPPPGSTPAVKPVASSSQLDMSDCAWVNRGTVVNGKETIEKVQACRQPDGSYEYVK
ncbi:MAG: peptidoglycan-binding domain-containing protein [Alphaproteobacteria bacterium]